MVVYTQSYTRILAEVNRASCPTCSVTFYPDCTVLHQHRFLTRKTEQGVHLSRLSLAGFEHSKGQFRENPTDVLEGDHVDVSHGERSFRALVTRLRRNSTADVAYLKDVKTFNKASIAAPVFISTEATAFERKKMVLMDSEILTKVTMFRAEGVVEASMAGESISNVQRHLGRKRIGEAWHKWRLLRALEEIGKLGRCLHPPGPCALDRALGEHIAEVKRTRTVKWVKKTDPKQASPRMAASGSCMDGDAKIYRGTCDYVLFGNFLQGKANPGGTEVQIGCDRSPGADTRYCCEAHKRELALPKGQVLQLMGGVEEAEWQAATGNLHIDCLRDGRGAGGEREYLVKFVGLGRSVWVPATKLPPDAADLTRGYSLSDEERNEIREIGCAKPKQDQRGPKRYHTDGALCLITDNRIFLATVPVFVSESCTQVFYFMVKLLTLFDEEGTGCEWVFNSPMAYDAACQIKKFILNRRGLHPLAERIARWAEGLLACDRMHYAGHKKAAIGEALTWCEQCCNPDNIPEFDKVLTEKAEEAFQVSRFCEHLLIRIRALSDVSFTPRTW